MSKSKSKSKSKPAPAVATPEPVKDTGPVVWVNPKYTAKHGGARGAYQARLVEFDGKPLADFEASCAANPPSVPGKGKLVGTQEPFSGWKAWFVKTGMAMFPQP
jgi:hypothetical protein